MLIIMLNLELLLSSCIMDYFDNSIIIFVDSNRHYSDKEYLDYILNHIPFTILD